MRITILNGDPGPDPGDFDRFVQRAAAHWQERGHHVTQFTLRNMNLRPCNGCFNCWWKTPGHCVIPDDIHRIWPVWLKSELGVFASPLSMGFVSAQLKHVVDRWIPLIHPYIELREGESNHVERYEKMPDLAGLLALGEGDDTQDLAITRAWLDRCAWHAHGRLRFCHTPQDDIEEVSHAPDRV